ncbi:unnamed protein product, partial [marine sediment metagenome]
MIQDSINRIWLLCKKNITLYIKKGPVLIFGLMFPFFLSLSWVIGREISLNHVFIGIIAMTSFFTATAISPVVLPIQTREKSLERILASPISLNEILLGIILASTLYSLIISSIITIIFILIFSIVINSLTIIFLMFLGVGLMSILGSLLGLLVAANVTKMMGMSSELKPRVDPEVKKFYPVNGPLNIKVMSMAFLIENSDSPVIWRGPMKMGAVRQFLG